MALLDGIVPNKAWQNKEGNWRKTSTKTGAREKEKADVKRYNMVLPEKVYEDLKTVADMHSITIAEVLRKYIKLGLIASEIEETPGLDLVLREEGKPDKTLVLI